MLPKAGTTDLTATAAEPMVARASAVFHARRDVPGELGAIAVLTDRRQFGGSPSSSLPISYYTS
jgi:hypothetical protein